MNCNIDIQQYYLPGFLNYFYLDSALEEGNEIVVNFLVQKGYKPSLFANQMARINGHISLATKIESCIGYRNQVSIKNVYYNLNKPFSWNTVIPIEYRF